MNLKWKNDFLRTWRAFLQIFFLILTSQKHLLTRKIENDVDVLRKSRFFIEFNTVESSLTLARKIVEEELSGGTDKVRAQALAWCARFLSSTEELDKAEEYLKIAKGLESSPEIDIANAFISSYKGDKSAALGILAKIDLPAAKSAALMIVTTSRR